jgi:Flp pilus assembly protein TadD
MIDTALLEEERGRTDAALELFEGAARHAPDNVALRLKLAQSYLAAGRKNEAHVEYRELLAANPADPNAIVAVARYHAQGGRAQQALETLRAGRRTAPTSTQVMAALARLLSSSPDASVRGGPEALALASEFCRQTANQNPQLLGALAAAQAENGQFNQAAATIDLALQRARALPASAARNELVQRLQLEGGTYSSGQPLRTTNL